MGDLLKHMDDVRGEVLSPKDMILQYITENRYDEIPALMHEIEDVQATIDMVDAVFKAAIWDNILEGRRVVLALTLNREIDMDIRAHGLKRLLRTDNVNQEQYGQVDFCARQFFKGSGTADEFLERLRVLEKARDDGDIPDAADGCVPVFYDVSGVAVDRALFLWRSFQGDGSGVHFSLDKTEVKNVREALERLEGKGILREGMVAYFDESFFELYTDSGVSEGSFDVEQQRLFPDLN